MNYLAHEAAKQLGLSVPALHYYEKTGLLPAVKRNQSGHRIYTESDLEWLSFIVRLREADVPIREIKAYVDLLLQGTETMPARQALLEQYRQEMQAKIRKMEAALQFMAQKQAFYQQIMESGEELPCSTFAEEWEAFKAAQEGGSV